MSSTSSASALAPQLSVVFNRDDARALDVRIGAASTVVRAGFGGAIVKQSEIHDDDDRDRRYDPLALGLERGAPVLRQVPFNG
jgi:multidrug efflux pump subunit AcrB